jgi:hypothetical protein
VRRLMWLVLLGMAGVSLVSALVDAWHKSNDFQWSPSRLMWQGLNPYEVYLHGDRSLLILDQAPNYGQLLYVILGPIAALPWPWAKAAWAAANVGMLGWFASGIRAALPSPSQRQWWLFALVLACVGYPVKLAIGNGQQAVLCLAAVMMVWVGRDRPWLAGLGLALLACKYSFGAFVGLAMLVLGFHGAVLAGAAIYLGGWLFFSAWTHTPALAGLFQPLMVAQKDVPLGFFDLMTVGRMLSRDQGLPNWAAGILIGLPNLAFFVLLWLRRRRAQTRPEALALALGAAVLMSLGTVYHLGYDMVASLFWVGALLVAQAGMRVNTSFKYALAVAFVAYWSLPRLARFMGSHNPLNEPWMVGLLALGLVGAAFASLLAMPEADEPLRTTSGQ